MYPPPLSLSYHFFGCLCVSTTASGFVGAALRVKRDANILRIEHREAKRYEEEMALALNKSLLHTELNNAFPGDPEHFKS